MSMFSDLLGTIKQTFSVGLRGVTLKNKSGTTAGNEVLQVRNATDAGFSNVEVLGVSATGLITTTGNIHADGTVTADVVTVDGVVSTINGNNIVSDGNVLIGAAANQVTLVAPASGGATTLTFPVGAGTNGYVLSTNGSGTLSWIDVGTPAAALARWTAATTTVNFDSGATIAGDSIPINSVIDKVQVIIDTAFDTAATISVGITGNTTKYMATTDSALNFAATSVFEVHPGLPAEGSATAISIGYTAASATVGSARVIVTYAAPL